MHDNSILQAFKPKVDSQILFDVLELYFTFFLFENLVKRELVAVFNVPPSAKIIWRLGHSLKSHPTDLRSWG